MSLGQLQKSGAHRLVTTRTSRKGKPATPRAGRHHVMTQPLPAPRETVSSFEAMAALVYAAESYEEIYQSICDAAVRLVDGCDHASLMLMRHGKPWTAAASDDIAALIDQFERELNDGPCLDAINDESAFVDTDLTDGSPWPTLHGRVLAETPVRGMAGFRLVDDGEKKTGALNLFSDTPGALTATSVDQAILLVSFVSVALLAAEQQHTAATLRAGLASNREIGKAIGLMMAFHHVDDNTAFSMLRQTSQDMNIKITEVAREIIDHQNTRRAEPGIAPR